MTMMMIAERAKDKKAHRVETVSPEMRGLGPVT